MKKVAFRRIPAALATLLAMFPGLAVPCYADDAVPVSAAQTVMVAAITPSATEAEAAAFRKAVDDIFVRWSNTNVHPDVEGFVSIWDENAVKMAAGRLRMRLKTHRLYERVSNPFF